MQRPQRAIIIAAGMGRRLAPHTDDRPKAMVEVAGRTLLARQIDAYRAAGVDEICVVRGYQAARIDLPGLRYFENLDYQRNNILASLFCAEAAMDGGFYASYADLVFRPEVVARLAAAAADVDYALIVDRRWQDVYAGRTLHPEAEAEVARVDGEGRVLAVGKRKVPAAEAHGEFIGLCRFSARAAATLRTEYHQLLDERGPAAPFGDAARLDKAYLTDLLNHLIDRGERMVSVDIEGGWREIDTPQDLERARALVDW